jgi:hypothetical protein
MRNNLVLFGKFALGGILSYSTPRFLVAIGVPVDRWIVKMANWFSLAITNEAALWSGGTIICAILFAVLFVLDRRHRSAIVIGPVKLTQQNLSKRAPLIELRDYIAGLPGWEDIGEELQYLDLIKAFREAAHEGRFEVWGRLRTDQGFPEQEEILRKIPVDHWGYASLDPLRFPSRTENKDLITYAVDPNKRKNERGYFDLEVERVPAFEWAQSEDASRYRGDEDRQSVGVQHARQAIATVRDTEMHFALAYVETGRWDIRFADIVMKPGAPDKGFSPVEMRQAALDGDIRIWGRASQSGPHVLIPAGYWEIWQIDWYSALESKCRTDIAETGHYGGTKYYDLMVSKAEIEKRWPPES